MDIYKIAVLVLATLIITLLLRGVKSELSVFPPLILTVLILVVAINRFSFLYEELTSILPGDFAKKGFSYLLKVTGICLITDFVSDFSEDLGYESLSNAVNLFGRISMLMSVIPLIFEIVDF